MSFSSMMKSKPLTRKRLQSHGGEIDLLSTTSSRAPHYQYHHDTKTTSPTSSNPSQCYSTPYTPPQERRPSSFYSQPEILYPLKFTNPWDAPDLPQRSDIRTTQKNSRSENATAESRYNTQTRDQSHGYREQRVADTYRLQHTPVSEYIVARSWTQATMPCPLTPTPQSPSSRPLYLLWDNITGTIRRKSSVFTSGPRRNSSLTSQDPQFSRRASSVCSASRAEANTPSGEYVNTSVYSPYDASTVLNREHNRADKATKPQYRPQTPTTPASSSTATMTATQPQQHPPSQTHTIRTIQQQPLTPTSARAALLRGLNQTYSSGTGQQQPQPQHHPPTPRTSQTQTHSVFNPSLWSTDPIPAPTRRYQPPPPRPGAKILHSQTKDAKCCDQGKFLGVGTMRAVSPAGVDMLQGWMMSSLRKTKDTERGVKEVRRWLKHQDRATVEWVAEWLFHRWGCRL